jgi:hypothetical protein
VLLAAAPALAQDKKRIDRAADVPRYTYKIDGSLEDVVRDEAKFTAFARDYRRDAVSTLVALVLVATGTFQRLVAVVAFFLAANYAVCCLALIVLRRREPDCARPFRAWGYPWSAALVLAGAAAFLVGAAAGDTINAAGALALLALGFLVRRGRLVS